MSSFSAVQFFIPNGDESEIIQPVTAADDKKKVCRGHCHLALLRYEPKLEEIDADFS